jgi:hypothetical protein
VLYTRSSRKLLTFLQTSLSERDTKRLAAWAASVPFKEPLAWTFIPIFDKAVTNGLGGFGLESSLPATPMSGRSTPRTSWSGFTGYGSGGNSAYGTPRNSIDATISGLSFSGTPKQGAAAEEASAWQAVQVDVPMFNKVKASYTEDSLHVSRMVDGPSKMDHIANVRIGYNRHRVIRDLLCSCFVLSHRLLNVPLTS